MFMDVAKQQNILIDKYFQMFDKQRLILWLWPKRTHATIDMLLYNTESTTREILPCLQKYWELSMSLSYSTYRNSSTWPSGGLIIFQYFGGLIRGAYKIIHKSMIYYRLRE